MSQKTPE